MRIITNQKLIVRNRRIGQYLTVGSLLVLGGGLYLSFNNELINWAMVALLGGFVMSQAGIYFGSRWGRSPRPDERVSEALKGLGDQYTLYHYNSPVPHLLIGPAGIWVLMHFSQGGEISYDEKKGRWKQKGGNLYLKIFAQEGLGRPELDVAAAITDLEKFLQKKTGSHEVGLIDCALVFSSEKATIQSQETPYPALPIRKLKDLIRRKAKQSPTPPDLLARVQEILPQD